MQVSSVLFVLLQKHVLHGNHMFHQLLLHVQRKDLLPTEFLNFPICMFITTI